MILASGADWKEAIIIADEAVKDVVRNRRTGTSSGTSQDQRYRLLWKRETSENRGEDRGSPRTS